MSRIAERLEGLGFRVFMVPETPTMLFQGGFSLHDVTPAQIVALETVLLRTVMNTEDSFRDIAEVYGDDTVFLCDRGMMDTKAYVSSEMWSTILSNLGKTEVQLRDQRYEAVIHMVTAADGAEEFYTLANNTARTETPEQARVLDKKTQDAWVGHPHLRVIDNHSDFDDKVREANAAVCRIVGAPEPMEDERKFLVASVGDIPVKSVTVDIEQRYLLTDEVGAEERVRKRGRDNSFVYTHTIKRRKGPGSAAELDRMITPADHLMALERRDHTCAPIFKKRTCFVWKGNYFELDEYTTWTPEGGGHLTVLEVELEDLDAQIELPPFVKIEREVTGESAFSNREIGTASEKRAKCPSLCRTTRKPIASQTSSTGSQRPLRAPVAPARPWAFPTSSQSSTRLSMIRVDST
jgi:CYTH domain-containing protein